MERIIIIGASGHGKVVADILLSQHRNVIGFVDAAKPIGTKCLSLSVLGKEEDLDRLIVEHYITCAIVAVGDNWIRAKIAARLSLPLTTAIAPSAVIGRGTIIGEGTVICAGSVIGPDCSIGKGCIINTHASLDHDSVMYDYSSLAPSSCTGGSVTIGEYSAICLGAQISHRIQIGNHCVIGAASFIRKDVNDHSVVYGVPGVFIRKRESGEKYL